MGEWWWLIVGGSTVAWLRLLWEVVKQGEKIKRLETRDDWRGETLRRFNERIQSVESKAFKRAIARGNR